MTNKQLGALFLGYAGRLPVFTRQDSSSAQTMKSIHPAQEAVRHMLFPPRARRELAGFGQRRVHVNNAHQALEPFPPLHRHDEL